MSIEQSREYAEQLKRSAKELIDGLGVETQRQQRIVRLIYNFVQSGFLENRAERTVRNE